MGVFDIKEEAEFEKLLNNSESTGSTLVIFFKASWHPPCASMLEVLKELSKECGYVDVAVIEAEDLPDLSVRYPVSSVPTTICVRGNTILETLEGASVPKLVTMMKQYNTPPKGGVKGVESLMQTPAVDPELTTRLEKLTRANKLMAFLSGEDSGSQQLIAILQQYKLKYGYFDVETDALVKENLLKGTSSSFPVMYYEGTCVGGVAEVKALLLADPQAFSPKVTIEDDKDDDLNTRLKKILNSNPVMLFMKGSPGAEQCGFSRTIVALLEEHGFKDFGSFDILEDNEVRQGLKEYSNWKTYPQLYINGELIGGLDVCKELAAEGELAEMAKTVGNPLHNRLRTLLDSKPVLVFMKGSPGAEECGFSRTITALLAEHGFKDYGHFDILLDNEVRQGLKEYSNWKTYPQLYINGELIGGLDVCKELAAEGELADMNPTNLNSK